MRITNIAPRPSTETGKEIATKTRTLNKNYPENLRGQFTTISGATVLFKPNDLNRGANYNRFSFEVSDEVIGFKNQETWTINLGTTAINLSTLVGGRIDGIAQEANRQYLVWAFLDTNFQWGGIGVTRKPYSSFSAISSGNKGSTATLTVTNGYQFTIGARVYIHNDKGTTNLIESNYGTVASIASSTSITVTMDNSADYGVNITAATGGYVYQHDNFKPYIVGASSQTLYSNWYCLVGEINTTSTNILSANILPIQQGRVNIQDTAVAITDYPNTLGFHFTNTTNKVMNLDPVVSRTMEKFYLFTIENKTFKVPYSSTNPLKVDLGATGLNGIVDGITFANGETYLVWAISNSANNALSTIVATRKPHSAFSAVSSGTKGSTATLTVTNGYQFTVGARAVVRNTNGTAPLYEYNWGTIASIASSTSITVTMDNDSSYGTNITSATGGEILQWDSFYPWVVGGSSQTLYNNNYALIGELYTDASTGNILRGYRVDDEYREVLRKEIVNTSSTVASSTAVTAARWLPLWADMASLQIQLASNAAAINMTVACNGSTVGFIISENNAYSAAARVLNLGYIILENYVTIHYTKNNGALGVIYILGYRVQGGMRL